MSLGNSFERNELALEPGELVIGLSGTLRMVSARVAA